MKKYAVSDNNGGAVLGSHGLRIGVDIFDSEHEAIESAASQAADRRQDVGVYKLIKIVRPRRDVDIVEAD